MDGMAILKKTRKSLMLVANISRLVERLCDQEEPNKKIFDDLITTLDIINSEEIDDFYKQALEICLVLRILNNLGYIEKSDILSKYIDTDLLLINTKSLLSDKGLILKNVNKAIKESQL